MLEPDRHDRLAQFGEDPAPAAGLGTRQQQLGHLLRDRRAAFEQPAPPEVANRRARDGDRIQTGMHEEPVVLGGDRRVDERLREFVRGQPRGPAAVGRPRFVQQLPVAIDHLGRFGMPEVKQAGRQRADPQVREGGDRYDGHSQQDPAPVHRFTSIVCVLERPETSGAYISSTRAGATVNAPAVVARTMYENSWWPSLNRNANSATRLSCRST
jgi:hypothetical protein